ncbi:hypothetical protein GCM10007916_21210 [Psychromonas marina]|uniref:Uncharacterized protein n=1 Tax=Psychromonas marina TaxID=88364 RepID=A0ABQ6E0Y8_9GAMM|nr:DUF6765 family protein [Psychromonas marina]GLS91053.1 hypothetical protein GCM10007916_21210 [Psychromonas marina]
MQIDGHHTLTYVVARLAGLDHEDADIVAYSAQYVDEATNKGVIKFDNGAMYHRTASAHKMLDYRNSNELANHRVWVPFHFLPGNGGLPAGENPTGTFIEKLICKPDSYIARDMLKSMLGDKDKNYSLHRLGITLHVYADTFAHQGFSGVNHKVNEVTDLSSGKAEKDDSFIEKMKNFFVSTMFPLGHGASLSHPDKPFLSWSYIDGNGRAVQRDNHQIFCDAADAMCRVVQCYIANDKLMNIDKQLGLSGTDKALIGNLLAEFTSEDGDERHASWLNAISSGKFSFGAVRLEFKPKGVGSWKHQAINQEKEKDKDEDVFPYHDDFLHSNWKLFHDALQAHRFDILHDILPKYGICVA